MTNRSAWLDAHEETRAPWYLRPLAWLACGLANVIACVASFFAECIEAMEKNADPFYYQDWL